MNLETKYAPQIIRMLENAQRQGHEHVVFEMRPMEFALQPHQIDFFRTRDEALDELDSRLGFGYLPGGDEHPIYHFTIERMLAEIKQANPLASDQASVNPDNNNLLNNKNMNKNNLENLQEEMRTLKFDEKLIEQMQKEMAKGEPGFQLRTQLPADKGQLDATLNFKKSGSSEYYFLNRYDLALSKAKPLEEGRHYFVISPNPEKKNENLTRKFDSVIQAIDYFKTQKHTSELAMGKTAADKMTLATMNKGTVDYVSKEFRNAFYSPTITNSTFVDKGQGFNVVQAANMLQGRSVFRDDLVNRGTGQGYKAWNIYLFDKPKDRYNNYTIKQFGENYGTDMVKELANYKIKELEDPKKAAQLIDSLKDGNRPVVTVTGAEGQEQKLRIEAMPRYGNYNFFELKGDPVKREQFLKEPKQELEKGQANIFERKVDQQQGMSV